MDEGFSGAYYEVGNENDGSWNPMLSIEEYTDRFVLLARAVKTADPSARSMGPVVSAYNRAWIDGFLDRLALVGGTGLLDWVSYHHYGGWISNSNADRHRPRRSPGVRRRPRSPPGRPWTPAAYPGSRSP
ncbi:MAG: glycoside hydrolase family 44 protein [Candidatus Moduliflexus flocculans]|nr:glycoside hydrolase family 44 protein [Candidatus Moduliflexus flocculans]